MWTLHSLQCKKVSSVHSTKTRHRASGQTPSGQMGSEAGLKLYQGFNSKAGFQTTAMQDGLSYSQTVLKYLIKMNTWLQTVDAIKKSPQLVTQLREYETDQKIEVFRGWFLKTVTPDVVLENKGMVDTPSGPKHWSMIVSEKLLGEYGFNSLNFEKKDFEKFSQYVCCLSEFIRPAV
jgi:hypothetical protein